MSSKKRLLLSVIIFIFVFIVGVVGYKIIGGEEWSLLDSLYMTVITLSTVGYGEIQDLSQNPAARIFTVFFIITCLSTIAFAVSSITSFIVEGELKDILGRKKMEKKISKLKEHYIVCGTGETAHTIIHELLLTKKKFVVVDPQLDKIQKMAPDQDLLYVLGDPADDEFLVKAGIERAKGVLCSLPTDEANLFVTITARSLNPKIRIVTKGIDIRSHKKMFKAGSNAVVSPAFIGGMRMVSEMVRPAVVSFLDMMLRDREKTIRFEEIFVHEGSPLVGKTVGDARIREKTGALLVAIRRAENFQYEYNPGKEAAIKANDVLIFIATPEMQQELEKLTL